MPTITVNSILISNTKENRRRFAIEPLGYGFIVIDHDYALFSVARQANTLVFTRELEARTVALIMNQEWEHQLLSSLPVVNKPIHYSIEQNNVVKEYLDVEHWICSNCGLKNFGHNKICADSKCKFVK